MRNRAIAFCTIWRKRGGPGSENRSATALKPEPNAAKIPDTASGWRKNRLTCAPVSWQHRGEMLLAILIFVLFLLLGRPDQARRAGFGHGPDL